MKYILDDTLGQAIINYLDTKPHGEVWKIISAMQRLEPYQEKKPRKKREPLKVVESVR